MSEILPKLGTRNHSAVVGAGFGRADELRALADIAGERESSGSNTFLIRGAALSVQIPPRCQKREDTV
jgi:hypothetical protein